jgi:holo-[acyl-carrier-protein] synthase
MSIIGIGVDIVKNNRLKKLIKNKLFLKRIFTYQEQKSSSTLKNKLNYYSKRFAAKEAFSKATGLGISKNLHFKNIEIKNDKKGRPSISLNPVTSKYLKKKFKVKSFKTNLSISDEKNYSVAYVIIEKL